MKGLDNTIWKDLNLKKRNNNQFLIVIQIFNIDTIFLGKFNEKLIIYLYPMKFDWLIYN